MVAENAREESSLPLLRHLRVRPGRSAGWEWRSGLRFRVGLFVSFASFPLLAKLCKQTCFQQHDYINTMFSLKIQETWECECNPTFDILPTLSKLCITHSRLVTTANLTKEFSSWRERSTHWALRSKISLHKVPTIGTSRRTASANFATRFMQWKVKCKLRSLKTSSWGKRSMKWRAIRKLRSSRTWDQGKRSGLEPRQSIWTGTEVIKKTLISSAVARTRMRGNSWRLIKKKVRFVGGRSEAPSVVQGIQLLVHVLWTCCYDMLSESKRASWQITLNRYHNR